MARSKNTPTTQDTKAYHITAPTRDSLVLVDGDGNEIARLFHNTHNPDAIEQVRARIRNFAPAGVEVIDDTLPS